MEKDKEEIEIEEGTSSLTKIIFAVIIVGVILTVFIPTTDYTCYRTISKTEMVSEPYQDTEVYFEKVPYSSSECNDISLGHNEKWDSSTICTDSNWLGTCQRYKKSCVLVINNLDNEKGGVFSLIGYGTDDNGAKLPEKEVSVYIQPQTSGRLGWYYYFAPNELVKCSYKSFIAGKKRVCKDVIKTKDERRTRSVTKYRDVEKTKDVQEKYKKTANWLWGSC